MAQFRDFSKRNKGYQGFFVVANSANFSFSRNVFKRLLYQGRLKSGLCGKGLRFKIHFVKTITMENGLSTGREN